MELSPCLGTPTRIPFLYILTSDVLGRSLGIPSSLIVNVNVAPPLTITRIGMHYNPHINTMSVPQTAKPHLLLLQ